MTFGELDPVVLLEPIPSHRLRGGDIGTVVHRHSDDCVEVEFLDADGGTQAVVRVSSDQLRRARAAELGARA